MKNAKKDALVKTVPSTKFVNVQLGRYKIYPIDAIVAFCPEHGLTHVETIITCGILLKCGCEWQRGAGSVDGWFREQDTLSVDPNNGKKT